MKLEQLVHVVEVANTQSISKAASNLLLSQPGLSASIKQLEYELGTELFVRSKKGVELTAVGSSFVIYAKRVLEQVDAMEALCKEQSKPVCPTLSVAACHFRFASAAVAMLLKKHRNDGARFVVRNGVSSDCIDWVADGVCDIGLSSRALRSEEIEQGAVAHLVAMDGIAVIVHGENRIVDLSPEQLRMIFTGEITDWSQLGGEKHPIAVYGREAGAGTREAFEEVLAVAGKCAYTNEYSSNGDIVGSISVNPNGIGYVSRSSVSFVKRSVKTVSVGGIFCCEETIRDGSYPLVRPFLMVTSANRPLSAEAQIFLEYAMSNAAADAVSAAGAVAPGRKLGE